MVTGNDEAPMPQGKGSRVFSLLHAFPGGVNATTRTGGCLSRMWNKMPGKLLKSKR